MGLRTMPGFGLTAPQQSRRIVPLIMVIAILQFVFTGFERVLERHEGLAAMWWGGAGLVAFATKHIERFYYRPRRFSR